MTLVSSTCSADGCEKRVQVKHCQLCGMHYARYRKTGSLERVKGFAKGRVCSVAGCEAEVRARGLCSSHHARRWRYGDAEEVRRPEGGKRWIQDGYVMEYRNGTSIGQHRRVMEEHVGRPLLPEETVHHVNGVRDDNRIENLELWSSRHPKGQRIADLVEWAKEILALYSEEA